MSNDSGNKIVESVKFLLRSVKQLSDRFVETDNRLSASLSEAHRDIQDLIQRVSDLEERIPEDGAEDVTAQRRQRTYHLPVQPESIESRVPILNLTPEEIVSTYASTPILLQPFGRPCGVGGRTISGEIEDVELEIFEQGTTWALESLDGGWLLVPRPGTLERRAQLQSLERIYTIEGVKHLPISLHLIQPARAVSVVHGRRWKLVEKGLLSASPDPLKTSLASAITELEQRVELLEARAND